MCSGALMGRSPIGRRFANQCCGKDVVVLNNSVFGFVLLLLLVPAAAANADTRFQRIEGEIRRLVVEQTVPSIVIAVAKDGRIIWEFAVGWADRERRLPATPHTPYPSRRFPNRSQRPRC